MTYTGRVIYCCPDCQGDLEEDIDSLWRPAEELGFTAAELTGAGL